MADPGAAPIDSPTAVTDATATTAASPAFGPPPTTAAEDFARERDRERHEWIEDEVMCVPRNYVLGAVVTGAGLLDPPGPVADGLRPREGAAWTVPASVRWLRDDGLVVANLGAVRRVRRVVLQADNNDGYFVEGSVDGAAYRLLWTAPAVTSPGLRTREVVLPQREQVRFLRVSARSGDGYYAVSEIEAYCK